ncbi:MAG: hypothetical protein JWO94_2523 [Verrucomicrobiaceae bacterium]|nr:hypothetical protein [Verrucomicrobiaceae bacterium]
MSTPSGSAGRMIRAALTIFPLGLILLGAGSFLFFFNHREKAEERAIKYAAGLRRELNEADLKRYEEVFSQALSRPAPERVRTLATFIESTMGPENMGYTVRQMVSKTDHDAPPLALDVEVTGSKKPRDLVVVIMTFLPGLTTMDELAVARPAAVFLNVAHSLTGLAKSRSIRFVALQNMASLNAYDAEDISPQERISHVLLLGPAAESTDAEIASALHLEGRGVVLLRPAIAPGDIASLLKSAAALQAQVTELAGRL